LRWRRRRLVGNSLCLLGVFYGLFCRLLFSWGGVGLGGGRGLCCGGGIFVVVLCLLYLVLLLVLLGCQLSRLRRLASGGGQVSCRRRAYSLAGSSQLLGLGLVLVGHDLSAGWL
jgi:hypothetical protein